ncbi:histidine phosphatase family protein [Weissella hellenica]|uniref:histidine phosphatase family protein n=1 Tax=Weissella hellenica TaxID=46256 RepID=UPI00388B263F
MSINLYIVRHGETYINKYDRVQGWTNAPLTLKGINDSEQAGKRLANLVFNNVYSSDLARAVETANIILTHNDSTAELQTLPDFREVFFGYFDGISNDVAASAIAKDRKLPAGITFNEISDTMSPFTLMDAIHDVDPTGDAESAATFWQRLMHGFTTIAKENNDGDNVLLIAHGQLLSILGQQFAQLTASQSEPKNGAVNLWQLTDNHLELKVFNDLTTFW